MTGSRLRRNPAATGSASTGPCPSVPSDGGASSTTAHVLASCLHSQGILVSGGHANSGWASSRNRSSVEPDRPAHKTKTGSFPAIVVGPADGPPTVVIVPADRRP